MQQVTEWQPNSSLRVSVAKCSLPGRRWLQFIDAGYKLTPTPTGTTLTRYSTIGSRLSTPWQLRSFEAWGVTSDTMLLANIKQIAESK